MSSGKPVLLLAYHFPPDNASGSARPYRFYKYLPEYGYEPHVITASPQTGVQLPRITFVPAPSPTRRTLFGWVERGLRKTIFTSDEGMVWAHEAKKAVARAMRQTKFYAIVSTFPPINSHLVGSWAHRKFGVPWIADYRDPLVGNPFRPASGLPGWTDRLLEHHFLRHADASLCVTDVVLREWRAQRPAAASKIHLLWNGFDPEDEYNSMAKPLPSRSRRLLTHVGTLYGARSPVSILESFRRLVENNRIRATAVSVRLIGQLDPLIEHAHVPLFQWLQQHDMLYMSEGLIPRQEAQVEAREADYLLLIDITERNSGYTVPAKLFEYIRVGRPILAYTDEGSPTDRILQKAGIPYQLLYRGESEECMDEKIMAFLRFPSDPTPQSQWFLDQFDGRRQTATLARLLDKLPQTK
jgi:glycosyltransferase involved in cell wall biosynthesis